MLGGGKTLFWGGGRGEVNKGRNRYGWTFKRKRPGGGPDARSAIGTLSRKQSS